jgi:acylphosphatase
MAKEEAVNAIVSGNVQGVGFRALIMKQAIEYNLAGSAENYPDQTVHFTLQGDREYIVEALAKIRLGTKKSSNVTVTTTDKPIDPALKSFTIDGWASQSRHITNKYDLVFNVRPGGEAFSKDDAKAKWHQILEHTLTGDDLAMLHPDDRDPENLSKMLKGLS